MKRRVTLEALARASFWGLSALSSIFALLCWIPFTWTNFVYPQQYPVWVALFLKLHGVWIAGVGLFAGYAFRQVRYRWIFLGSLILAGILAYTQQWILSWQSGRPSLILAFLVWIPYVMWEAVLAEDRPGHVLTREDVPTFHPLERAALFAGLIVGVAYSLPTASSWVWDKVHAFALLEILLLQLFPFLLLVATMRVIRAFAYLTPHPYYSEWVLSLAVAGGLIFLIFKNGVLESLDYRGVTATSYALFFAFMGVLTYAREAVRVQEVTHFYHEDAQRVLFAPPLVGMCEKPVSRLLAGGLALGITLTAPWVVPKLLLGKDWNGLIESLSVLAVWTGAFIFGTRALSPREGQSVPCRDWFLPLGVLLVSGVVYAIDGYADWAAPTISAVHKVQRRWIDQNPSLRWTRKLFRMPTEAASFYAYLQSQTNISRDTAITPKEIVLGTRGPVSTARPNIFIFVIDSLRQDYVGAYNAKVRFTPQIDAWARESLVFKNAFTVFGATGLSEPSIWAGAHLIHKQYVKPFAPMNSLEKLLEVEGYRRFITQDAILAELLKPSTTTDPLDAETTGNYLFCSTLKELTAKLPSASASRSPLFVYTQPQDIHVSVVQRNPGPLTSTDPRFEGFYLPYASRIAAFDRCFGEFLQSLKNKGLYENSIIIFTADHGDSLGEGGRWGHAYTIYPEILRVPLIVHLPESLRAQQVADVDQPAYLIDITPTLYRLLGWTLKNENPLYGRSLFAASAEALKAVAMSERVAVSSYGPVYGVMEPKKNHLYVADAINYTAFTMPLTLDPQNHTLPASHTTSKDYNTRIRQHLDRINAFYR